MRRHYGAILALWLAMVLFAAGRVPSAAQVGGNVVVITVHGAIDPIVAQYVKRGIRTAAGDGAQCMIIEMDTPGGLDVPMREIVKAILAAPLPIVTYVSPNGARAASAGLFIAYACSIIAMAPSTNIGAAHPVSSSSAEEMPETLNEKAVNDAVAYLTALGQQQGHNPEWAEEAIRKSVSIPAGEALEKGVINLVAEDLSDLLSQLDGREVETSRGAVTLHTATAGIRHLGMNLQENILHVIVDPTIAYLLLTIGIWGLIAEFSAPGISAGGIIGVICLVLFGVSVASLPLNWAGLGLIALAIALFILDIKAPTHGLLTAGGVGAFLLGSLMLFSPISPRAPAMLWPSELFRVSRWLIGAMTALTAGIFIVAVGAGIRAQLLKPSISVERLVGATGTIKSDCDPVGTVQLKGELWSAVAEGEPLVAGDIVEIVGWDGLRLRVAKLEKAQDA